MRIDQKLNIAIPVETSDGGTIYVHSTPISRDIFEQYFLPISKAFAALFDEGLGLRAGPSVAMLMLKQASGAAWEGPNGVQAGLVAEIHRLTNIVKPNGKGWQTIPFEDAIGHKILDAEEIAEVDNALAFFTCISTCARMPLRQDLIAGMGLLLGVQGTPLNCTEFGNSLPVSIETAPSTEMAPTS